MLARAAALLLAVIACAAGSACDRFAPDRTPPSRGAGAAHGSQATVSVPTTALPPEAPPPFAVRDNADAFSLVWFDADGPHTATAREQIPPDRREMVAVTPQVWPEGVRREPDTVWVADLRAHQPNGTYAMTRATTVDFDVLVSEASGTSSARARGGRRSRRAGGGARRARGGAASGPVAIRGSGRGGSGLPERVSSGAMVRRGDVVVYATSWCGACRATLAYLRRRGVPHVERDIEREPGARLAMVAACRRAGVEADGIPVIVIDGQVIEGFDQPRIESLLARR